MILRLPHMFYTRGDGHLGNEAWDDLVRGIATAEAGAGDRVEDSLFPGRVQALPTKDGPGQEAPTGHLLGARALSNLKDTPGESMGLVGVCSRGD
eukprot:6792453-Prorocentrum_lima.AAC.1